MEGTKSRLKHLHHATLAKRRDRSLRHKDMKTSLRKQQLGRQAHARHWGTTRAERAAGEDVRNEGNSGPCCCQSTWAKGMVPVDPRKKSEISVQKRAVQETAKMVHRTLKASGRGPELKSGPDHPGRASGRFILSQKSWMQS